MLGDGLSKPFPDLHVLLYPLPEGGCQSTTSLDRLSTFSPVFRNIVSLREVYMCGSTTIDYLLLY